MSTSFSRGIKRIAKIAALVVFSFLFLGFIIGLFYGKEMKKLMIEQLNKNLDTEISVGEFDFSVLRHFPYASLEMKQVMAKEVTENKNRDTLLYADHVSLLINILGLLNKDLTIRKIVVKNGAVNIKIDASGKDNYHFWKSSGDSSHASGVDLQNIEFGNVLVRYLDISGKQDYLLRIKEAELSGKFSNDLFTLNTDADLLVSHFIADQVNYLSEKQIHVKSGLKVNAKTHDYTFDKSTIRVEDLVLSVSGNVALLPDATRFNLAAEAREADLESFIGLMPKQQAGYFKNFRSKGKFYFSCTVKGDRDANHNPDFDVKFSIKDGTITPGGSEVSLEKLNASGTYRNHSLQQKSILEIPSISAVLGGRTLNAGLTLEDFNTPFLTLHVAADLDLARLRHFVKLDTLETLGGDLDLNISFAGKIKDLPRYNANVNYKVQTSGTIVLKDVMFRLKKNPLEFHDIHGSFSLRDNDVHVASLSGKISSSDFRLNGVFRNFITFLLIPGQDADVDAKVVSSTIDLDELLSNKTATSEEDTSYKMKFNPRLVCKLGVQIDLLQFRKFSAAHCQGEIRLADQVIHGNGLVFSAMNGTVKMDAAINAGRKDSVIMSCDAKCSGLDITQLFYQMENFGQSTMTDKNVKGKVSADVQFKSSWTTGLNINSKSVVSTSDITIENGELNDFRPILALSKYLRLTDLKHIKFSTLKNQVQISNRKIFIPNMEIKSSALNLTGSGIHDFDNMVDYKIQLLLSDVLGRKVKDQNTEFGEIEDDGLGRTKLFLTMKGPVDNPKIGYDKKGVLEKIKKEIRTERQNLKSLLKQEFSSHPTDTSSVQKKKKKEELQIDWDAKDEK